MKRIAVYTAIFGKKDKLNEPLNYLPSQSFIDYFCFTDNVELKSTVYQIVHKNPIIKEQVKKARFFKILGSEELVSYDYLIWHDGNIQLDADKIEALVKELGDNFLAAFCHPHRDNIFDESRACIKRNKDSEKKILIQLVAYMLNGAKTKSKLFETGILVKRNIEDNIFYNLWWDEVKVYTSRDQISLGYLIEKKNKTLSLLDGSGSNNPYSKYHPHIFQAPVKISVFKKIKIKIFEKLIDFLKSIQQKFQIKYK